MHRDAGVLRIAGHFVPQALHADHAHARQHGHLPRRRRVRQHPGRAAVLQHVAQAPGRKLRIQRQVGASRLHRRQHAHDHLDRALHADAHQRLRPQPLAQQVVRQAVGARVQFPIAEGFIAEQQRRGPRLARGMRLQLPENRHGRALAVVVAAPGVQLRALGGREPLHRAGRLLRAFGHRLQQGQEMAGQPLDGGRLEQFGRVDPGERQRPGAALARLQHQFELRLRPLQRLGPHGEPRHRPQQPIVLHQVVEHDLEQRARAPRAPAAVPPPAGRTAAPGGPARRAPARAHRAAHRAAWPGGPPCRAAPGYSRRGRPARPRRARPAAPPPRRRARAAGPCTGTAAPARPPAAP